MKLEIGAVHLGARDSGAGVSVIVTDEPEKARMAVKGGLALYIGGMGARTSQTGALELLAEELL